MGSEKPGCDIKSCFLGKGILKNEEDGDGDAFVSQAEKF